MEEFVSGATALGCCAVALFFLRFWTQTRDRLFAIFALAFLVFAINRGVLAALDDDAEARTFVYVARALAFALIALAVLDKNRRPDS